MGLGAAGVKAQVRIGGNTPPNPAAALDLNAAEGTTAGTKGLALPRVTLGSNTATLDGSTANITGMLVYNTGGSLSVGVYYWNGSNWNRVDDGFLGGDTIVGNEVTGATPNRGLARAGSGSKASPFTLGIAPGGIDTSMIAPARYNGSILVYSNGVWYYSRWKPTSGWTVSVPAGGQSAYGLIQTFNCLSQPIVVMSGMTPAEPVVLMQDGTGYYLWNHGTTNTTVSLMGLCWTTN